MRRSVLRTEDQDVERRYNMGDKGGKKDKEKSQKQKKGKQAQDEKARQDKQPKRTP